MQLSVIFWIVAESSYFVEYCKLPGPQGEPGKDRNALLRLRPFAMTRIAHSVYRPLALAATTCVCLCGRDLSMGMHCLSTATLSCSIDESFLSSLLRRAGLQIVAEI